MNKTKTILLIGLAGVVLSTAIFAASTAGANISNALGTMCATVKNALAVGMMLLVVAAAVIYAVGQVLGAETRARASVWATAMFIGAIIGALIYIIMPMIIATVMVGGSVDSNTWVTQCCVEGAKEDCASLGA